MNRYEFWHELRNKESNTLSTEEKLLLKYRDILTYISECCVEESKCHITSIKAIENIRSKLGELNYDDLILENKCV